MLTSHTENLRAPDGLRGLTVADTRIGEVRGAEGFYHFRQYSAVDIAATLDFEDAWHLLVIGALPDPTERRVFGARIAEAAALPAVVLDALPSIASAIGEQDGLGGLTAALQLLGAAQGVEPLIDADPEKRLDDVIRLAAGVPSILAALHRLRCGQPIIDPDPSLGVVENYLAMVTGERPSAQHAAALSKYMTAAIEHGFNASTFTARVIASTGADPAACLAGALGALSGPLHGGAPSRALDALDEIGSPDRIDSWVRAKLESGERIMGFGHAVYRTEDPRSRMLKSVAREIAGDRAEFAVAVEERVQRLLAELKPGRELHANVEFYAAIVMEGVGLPRAMFTPTFAASRVIGWTAHILEQALERRIIRPLASYVGPPAPQPLP